MLLERIAFLNSHVAVFVSAEKEKPIAFSLSLLEEPASLIGQVHMTWVDEAPPLRTLLAALKARLFSREELVLLGGPKEVAYGLLASGKLGG